MLRETENVSYRGFFIIIIPKYVFYMLESKRETMDKILYFSPKE